MMNYLAYEHYRKIDLAHHGIKGQKWGTRNGPPYPLKEGSHAPREKTAAGKDYADKKLKSIGNKKLAGIDPATITLVSYIAAIGTIYAIHEIQYSSDKKKNIKNNTSNIKKMIEVAHSAAEDLKAVNPDYADPTDIGARVNCTMCSTAYELRRRGYDVVAQKTEMGRKPKDAAAWFGIDKKDINTYKSRDEFERALKNEPDGARGLTFTSYGMFNSHHCMIWEKSDGKILISDGQVNASPKSVKESGISTNGTVPYRYIRTDNAEINWDLIRDAVKERED